MDAVHRDLLQRRALPRHTNYERFSGPPFVQGIEPVVFGDGDVYVLEHELFEAPERTHDVFDVIEASYEQEPREGERAQVEAGHEEARADGELSAVCAAEGGLARERDGLDMAGKVRGLSEHAGELAQGGVHPADGQVLVVSDDNSGE